MESGQMLNELNMTEDEVKRFTNALKDEKFRVMLRDYAQELSDPENKKRYEEEIKLLEQGRGNNIDFIHPNPFRVLRTSLNGKQKCFINICTNEKVGKPQFAWEIKDGRKGQQWSLPHSLHPGRQERDAKGNNFTIYDVVFHADTLHIASKNKMFMDMVDKTAMQGIEDNFKVSLDKNNVREMNTKYKGTPQPCVIRKPIQGYASQDPPAGPDPLAFPYPYEKGPNNPTTQAAEVPESKHRGVSEVELQKTKKQTQPHYTLKYRSFIDLQDYRCSRDSAQSPRPKEIVVTVDVPLLKSARDTSLEVHGKSLVLESETPAYRLEVSLAYPVDEDKGEAKFNKHTGKLTITLPVLPASETLVHATGFTQAVHDPKGEEEEEEEEKRGAEQEEQPKEQERSDEINETEEEHGKKEEEKSEGNREVKESDKQTQIVKAGGGWRKEKIGEGEKNEEGKSELGNIEINKGSEEERCDRAGHRPTEDCSVNGFHRDTEAIMADKCSEESRSEHVDVSPCAKNQADVHKLSGDIEEERGGTEQTATSQVIVDAEEFKAGKLNMVHTTPSSLHHPSSDKSQTDTSEGIELEPDLNQDCKDCMTPESKYTPAPNPDEDGAMDPEKLVEEVVNEEDLQTEQMVLTADCNGKPPPALLRETDVDGKERVISDHSTSAGFIFQNSLLYELD